MQIAKFSLKTRTMVKFAMLHATKVLTGAHKAQAKPEDGSTITVQDEKTSQAFLKAFAHFRIPLVSEEDKPRFDPSVTTFLLCDPIDGSGAFARNEPRWCIALNLFENGVPTVSVTVTWGLIASNKVGTEFAYPFGSPAAHRGVVIVAEKGQAYFAPLQPEPTRFVPFNCHEPRALTKSSTLFVNPDVKIPASYDNAANLRIETAPSTILAQMLVLLGQADGALFGPNISRSGAPNQPGPKLWDVLSSANEDAGLASYILTGESAGGLFEGDDILAFIDEDYRLTEQILVCHPANASELLGKIAMLRAQLGY